MPANGTQCQNEATRTTTTITTSTPTTTLTKNNNSSAKREKEIQNIHATQIFMFDTNRGWSVQRVFFFFLEGEGRGPLCRASKGIQSDNNNNNVHWNRKTVREWERGRQPERVGTWDMTSALYCYFPNEWELLKDIIAASWSKHTHTLAHTQLCNYV